MDERNESDIELKVFRVGATKLHPREEEEEVERE